MRIYLAARYSRFPEMQGCRTILESLGHMVTSRWINGDHDYKGGQSPAEQRVRFAQEDWADLLAADCVISFTEEPGKAGGRNRGGRHVEFGAHGERPVQLEHVGTRIAQLSAMECLQGRPDGCAG